VSPPTSHPGRGRPAAGGAGETGRAPEPGEPPGRCSDPALGAALARVPLLAGHDPAALRFTPLASLSNRCYRVELPDGRRCCLRLPGPRPAPFIDRARERENALAVARAGLAPPVLFFDPRDGLMVTEYISGRVTLGAARLGARPGALARAGRALARLHREGPRFAGRIEPLAVLDRYLEALPGPARSGLCDPGAATGAGEDCPPGAVTGLADALAPLRARLAAAPWEPAPCHGDPVCANLLDGEHDLVLVDWEYAAMGDPAWDLAWLALDAGLDRAGRTALLAAHGGARADPALTARVELYLPICAAVEALWALSAPPRPGRGLDDLARRALRRARALLTAGLYSERDLPSGTRGDAAQAEGAKVVVDG